MNLAVAEAEHIDGRAGEQVGNQLLRRVVGGLQRRRRLFQRDDGLAQPDRIETDAPERQVGKIEVILASFALMDLTNGSREASVSSNGPLIVTEGK